jgi:hypothetical protein
MNVDLLLGQSQLQCDIAWAVRFLSTAAIMAPSLAGVRTARGKTSMHTCRRCYIFCLTKTPLHSSKTQHLCYQPGQRSAQSITPVRDYHRHPRINTMSQYSSRVFATVIRPQLSLEVRCVSWKHTTTRAVVTTNKTAEMRVAHLHTLSGHLRLTF